MAVAGGVPIGAMLASAPAADAFDVGSHGSTFGGNALTCAVGLAVLETLESEGVLANCVAMGERLRSGLRQRSRISRNAPLLARSPSRPSSSFSSTL